MFLSHCFISKRKEETMQTSLDCNFAFRILQPTLSPPSTTHHYYWKEWYMDMDIVHSLTKLYTATSNLYDLQWHKNIRNLMQIHAAWPKVFLVPGVSLVYPCIVQIEGTCRQLLTKLCSMSTPENWTSCRGFCEHQGMPPATRDVRKVKCLDGNPHWHASVHRVAQT